MTGRWIPWRRTCPPEVTDIIEKAQQAHIYLLQQTGPTGFVLREQDSEKKVKVLIGDCHCCTCAEYMKGRELCVHIIWILLRKLRLSPQNQLIFQRGLVEREINQILRGHSEVLASKNSNVSIPNDTKGKDGVEAREIKEDEVCPICQENLLEGDVPLTYCKYGCANSIHIKCMKVYGEHQISNGERDIKCPLCRADFIPLHLLREEYRKNSKRKTRSERNSIHLGKSCNKCRKCPIQGSCYRCMFCTDLYLCSTCFDNGEHSQHSFECKEKVTSKWKLQERNLRSNPQNTGVVLPEAIISDIQNRELTVEDYQLLLQLDKPGNTTASRLTKKQVDKIPTVLYGMSSYPVRAGGASLIPTVAGNSRLQGANEGREMNVTCGVCNSEISTGNRVKKLPCNHWFHLACIDQWLVDRRDECPIDGIQVVVPVTPRALSPVSQCSESNSSDNAESETRKKTNKKRDTSTKKKETELAEDLLVGFSLLGTRLEADFEENSNNAEATSKSVGARVANGRTRSLRASDDTPYTPIDKTFVLNSLRETEEIVNRGSISSRHAVLLTKSKMKERGLKQLGSHVPSIPSIKGIGDGMTDDSALLCHSLTDISVHKPSRAVDNGKTLVNSTITASSARKGLSRSISLSHTDDFIPNSVSLQLDARSETSKSSSSGDPEPSITNPRRKPVVIKNSPAFIQSSSSSARGFRERRSQSFSVEADSLDSLVTTSSLGQQQ
eukprot:Nk52_evm73s1444 gene=Nk52_evmTU73s1444